MKRNKTKSKTESLTFESTSIEKTQAYEEFLQLLDTINKEHVAVEITDGNKPIAFMLSYPHWLIIKSKLDSFSQDLTKNPPKSLIGSIKIVGDLEKGSREAAKLFFKAAANSAKTL